MSILRFSDNSKVFQIDTKDCEDGSHTGPGGDIFWIKNGMIHRDDGPARVTKYGGKQWYVNDKRHRIDGPAVEWTGTKEWWFNGVMHRDDGPAYESVHGESTYKTGVKIWVCMGQIHRLDGPAIERLDGTKKYFIYDVEYTPEEFELAVIKLKG